MREPPARAALDAVRARLQEPLAIALCKYATRRFKSKELTDAGLSYVKAAFAELQNIPPHLWPTPKINLDSVNFDDDAKAVLFAACGQGGVLEASWNNLDKLERRQATRRAERFIAGKPRGRQATINTAIADHLIAVLERLAGRAVGASRHPPGSKPLDGKTLDGKPHGLLFKILLHALWLAQWRYALRENAALLSTPEEPVKALPTAEALAMFLRRRPARLARLGLTNES